MCAIERSTQALRRVIATFKRLEALEKDELRTDERMARYLDYLEAA